MTVRERQHFKEKMERDAEKHEKERQALEKRGLHLIEETIGE